MAAFMNKLLFSIIVFASSYVQAQTVDSTNSNIDKFLAFTNANYNMGKIPAGKPLEYNVTIKNISKDTLIIQEVKAGCGCTTPKYRTGEAILPGKSTFITLGFNGDAHGEFSKFADIYFKGGLTKQLKFNGITYSDSTNQKQLIN